MKNMTDKDQINKLFNQFKNKNVIGHCLIFYGLACIKTI